jgi:ABC-2 type transport system permease protein/lipopolysaccharide transport system permease protein
MTAPILNSVVPDEPPPSLRFRRSMNLGTFARLAWRSRLLAFTLSERELRVRYKQALLGVAWAFVGPLSYVLVFTVFFGHTAKIETFHRPYPVFSYAALIPWGFFAQVLGRASTALVDNLVLLNKVACPRETFVFSSISTALVDMVVSAIAFPIVVLAFGQHFYGATIYLIPVLALQVAFAAAISLLLSSLLMYVRDIRHLLPLAAQLLMFATPVVWGQQALAARTSRGVVVLYAALNPMATVCETYRRTLVFGQGPDWTLLAASSLVTSVFLVAAYWVFKKLEPGFADVA